MIDLRSDILGGLPEAAMQAMISVANEPPCFDLGEDPNQNALEETVADLYGYEKALYVPTGTMANQIALRIHCAPGETVIADRNSHLAINEMASTAGLNGAALFLLDGERGHPKAGDIERALAATPRSAADRDVKLIWLENTHNWAGGTVMSKTMLRKIVITCKSADKPLHLDGARLWNAAVASNSSPNELTSGVDSTAVSLNKAVGAPVGALLLGEKGFIAEAIRVRRMFGGWWRPVGILAAAALAALEGFSERVKVDHFRAKCFASELNQTLPAGFSVQTPDTNIVMLHTPENVSPRSLVGLIRSHGVLAKDYGKAGVRFVFHSRVTENDIEPAVEAVTNGINHGKFRDEALQPQ